MPPDQTTVARYRKRAAELRIVASETNDPETREVILKAAEAYERMAEWQPVKSAKRGEKP